MHQQNFAFIFPAAKVTSHRESEAATGNECEDELWMKTLGMFITVRKTMASGTITWLTTQRLVAVITVINV